MDKLTTEQKAERYVQALDRAKKWYNAPNIDKMPTYGNRIIEEIFPELKESEDERVRKEIIDFIYDKTDTYELREKSNSWLAWLEKQGEQKPTEFDDTNAKRMFIKALERVEEQNNKGYKLTDCDKISWWEDFKTYASCTVEQNLADKVEPKFHKGYMAVFECPKCYTKYRFHISTTGRYDKDRF